MLSSRSRSSNVCVCRVSKILYRHVAQGKWIFISIINKTIDNNEKNDIQKDENNIYIEDNEKSVKIYVKFLESDNIFDMEAISNNGIENFIQNYATFSFKCTKIDYHKNGNVKSLFFEEI